LLSEDLSIQKISRGGVGGWGGCWVPAGTY